MDLWTALRERIALLMRLIRMHQPLYNLRGNFMLEVYRRPAMCIRRNTRITAPSSYHCRRSSTMRFTSLEYAMSHIVIRGLLGLIFVYIISLRARHSKKN
jgi:hypothetical protein